MKGSQGAGKVDESLDRTKMEIEPEGGEGPSNAAPKLPAGARKKKGRR